MDKLLRDWITEIITENERQVSIAVRQRAKFEGWLKFELAVLAEKKGAQVVQIEPISQDVSNNLQRADISFLYNGINYVIELKTPNTNWDLPGIDKKTRPITKNIADIIADGRKLQQSSVSVGLVAFVMFPVPPENNQWEKYIQRIASALDLPVAPNTNCTRTSVPLDNYNKAGLIICTFRVFS